MLGVFHIFSYSYYTIDYMSRYIGLFVLAFLAYSSVIMPTLEQAKTARKTSKSAVTRLGNNLLTKVAEKDSEGLSDLVTKFKSAYSKFTEDHLSVVDLDAEENAPINEKYLEAVELNYFNILSKAQEYKDKSSETKPSESSESTESKIVGLLSLPALRIDPWDGNSLTYHAFISAFKSTVEVHTTDPNIRLARLFFYLRGEAREVVQSCLVVGGAEGYKSALARLKSHFGTDHHVAQEIIKNLRSTKPVKTCKDFQKLSNELDNALEILQSIGSLAELDTQSVIFDIISRFSNFVQNRWYKMEHKNKRDKGAYLKFKDLCKFCSEIAEEQADPVLGESARFRRFQRAKAATAHNIQADEISEDEAVSVEEFYSADSFYDSDSEFLPSVSTVNASQTENLSRRRQDSANMSCSGSNPGSNSARVRRPDTCTMCSEQHFISKCEQFRKMPVKDRLAFVVSHELCQNCLRGNHTTDNCLNQNRCFVCQAKHTSFLHTDQSSTSCAVDSDSCLLPVVKVRINDSCVVNAGLDNFSTSSFITKGLVNRLKLEGKDIHYMLRTMHGSTPTNSKEVDFTISSLSGDEKFHMTGVRIVDHIPMPKLSVDLKEYPHLSDLGISSEMYKQDLDILIGQDSAQLLVPMQVRKNSDPSRSNLIGIKFSLGWAVQGKVPTGTVSHSVVCNFVSANLIHESKSHANRMKYPVVSKFTEDVCCDSVVTCHLFDEDDGSRTLVSQRTQNCPISCDVITDDQVVCDSIVQQVPVPVDDIHKLWDIENGAFTDSTLSVEDKKVLDLWDSTCCLVDGHYMLPIPWKNPNEPLPNNFSVAIKRLDNLVKRLTKTDLMSRYNQEITKLIDSKYAEVIPDSELNDSNRIFYLPHHVVFNVNKPSKVRVVFDCSAKFEGLSLNERCYQGPDLVNKLLFVLLRFRDKSYGVVGDLREMYNQILIPPRDRDALRFLWYQNDRLVHMRMRVNVFGGIWCSSSSSYALRRIVMDNPDIDPLFKDAILNSMYVDDLSLSVHTVMEVQKVIFQFPAVLKLGGFEILKFAVNDERIIQQIPLESRAKEVHDFSSGSVCRALGVRWHVKQDLFCFEVKSYDFTQLTRRIMLKFLASIFDPLGLVSPLVVEGKLLLQQATRLQLDWDVSVPSELHERWNSWYGSLHNSLSKMTFPRCVKSIEEGYTEYHFFCDSSQQAYGISVYCRSISTTGEISSALLMSKSHIAPIKCSHTVPRLELQSAKLAVDVYLVLKKESLMQNSVVRFWSDSMIVISYIQNETKRFHTFVENRVSYIRSNTDPNAWGHIDSASNPSDLLTRPFPINKANAYNLWINGPSCLLEYARFWSKRPVTYPLDKNDPEVKVFCTQAYNTDESTSWIDRICSYFSSWSKILKSVAWMRRFALLKSKRAISQGSLTVQELDRAHDVVIRHVQSKSFGKELACLNSNKPLLKSSRILSLNPFLDKDGILRIGGRTGEHPIILSHDDSIIVNIIRHFHRNAHLGVEWTLGLLREKYWITKARRVIRRVLRKCLVCKRLYAKPASQLMADLHPAKIHPYMPAFTHVGVDCFGPYYTNFYRGQKKRYGCIFTCMSSRAIHLEMLHSLDADSFLNCLRSFQSHRPNLKHIYCDNATNFRAADAELLKAFSLYSKSTLKDYAVSKGIQFTYIDPTSAHQAGNWERLIGIVKRVLKAVLPHASRLTDEVLQTIFCEVEAIVNSRPLTRLSDDPRDFRPLTPNLLLSLGDPTDIPLSHVSKAEMYRSRYKYCQHIANMFWSRWLKLYLPSLNTRSKWRSTLSNVKEGELVLMVEKGMPRNLWPLAIVEKVFHGRDQLVRSVVLRTRVGRVLRRSIHQIVRLEVDA